MPLFLFYFYLFLKIILFYDILLYLVCSIVLSVRMKVMMLCFQAGPDPAGRIRDAATPGVVADVLR